MGCEADRISTDAFLLDRETRNKLGITGYNPARPSTQTRC